MKFETKILSVEKLYGGRSTDNVERINKIYVRRPHKKESDFANKILIFLNDNGFKFSQRYLGSDVNNLDYFDFIEGFVPNDIGNTNIDQLVQFMKIVKLLHDVSIKFTNNNKEVICHNDLSPCNVVFENDKPKAIINWDTANIGKRWEDLTYIVWLWVNLGNPLKDDDKKIQEIKTALEAYGVDTDTIENFTDKLILRMQRVIDEMDVKNPQYLKTKEWVKYSQEWVGKNKDKINQLLKLCKLNKR